MNRMTSTVTAPKPATSRPVSHPATLRLAPNAHKWQLPWIVIGVLLVAGSALVFAISSIGAGNRQPVLAVARSVTAGAVLHASDLQVVHVSIDAGVNPVNATDEGTIVGHTAAVPLVPGTLLTASEIGPMTTVGANQAVVGMALKAGQFPPEIVHGSKVLVVETAASLSAATANTGAASTPIATTKGTVIGIQQSIVTSSDTTVISLLVDSTDAARLAGDASANRITLVLLSATS